MYITLYRRYLMDVTKENKRRFSKKLLKTVEVDY